MSLLGSWILAPAALVVLVCGLGLLVDGALRPRAGALPGALVPAAGLAALIVVAGIPALWDATAELAAPLAAAAAVGGLALGRPWRDRRLPAAWPWPVVVAAATFAVFAWPSLGSGHGSIAGYVSLDDSATWLAHVDHVLRHGRDLSGLAPSSYARTLEVWLGGGYPVGAFLPLGVAAALTGQDPAGPYQAVIAVVAVICALGLYACARPLARTRGRATLAAVLAVQASLFLGYAQWGSIKEVVVAALLPLIAVAAVRGAWAPLVLGVGALAGALGLNGLAWGAPALVLGGFAAWRSGRLPAPATALGLVALLALACLPALVTTEFVRQTTDAAGGIAADDDLGNLVAPLSPLQAVGPWPAGDFRLDPDPLWLAAAIAVATFAAAAAGTALAVQRRAWGLVALVALSLTGAAGAVAIGSPWVDAKAYAIVSPMLFVAACALVARGLGAAAPLRLGAAAAIAALAGATAWSTIAVARDVRVAPRDRLADLHDVARFVGDRGPLLLLDFEIYGSRHLLRGAAPEGASDLRVRPVRLTDGTTPRELTTVEVDDVTTADLWAYRTLVRRRTPVGSRPPAAFGRTWAGEHWEVWERASGAPQPVRRLPLGTPLQPAAVPSCEQVRDLARTPGVTQLAAVPRTPPVVIDLLEAFAPPPWLAPDGVRPVVDGDAVIGVQLPAQGRWRVWVGGAVRGTLSASLGGRAVGERRHELSHDGQWMRFASAQAGAGPVELRLRYERGWWRPGRGAAADASPLGPVALTPAADDGELPVITLPARAYRELCDGRPFDWIEGS